jgi:beta-glucosidase
MLLNGRGWNLDPGSYVGGVRGIEHLGVPMLKMHDSGNGFRTSSSDIVGTVTVWPSPLAAASTWDEAMVQVGASAIGREFAGKDANILLGPAVNVHRVARGGRNFEYLSGEDPYLGARLARAYVIGVQSEGVMATVKHFAFNEQETARAEESSVVGARTAWELYYPPFEAAVQAGAGAVMCAYNKVNGTYCCENPDLLRRDLRGTMGFRGLVMSDWWATHSTSVAEGLDMDQPGTDGWFAGPKLYAVPRNAIDEAARHVLTAMYRLGLERRPGCTEPDCVASQASNQTGELHRSLARDMATAAVVLLKNNGILPLARSHVRRLAIVGRVASAPPVAFGINAGDLPMGDYYSGGGSGHVHGERVVSPLDGLSRRAAAANIEVLASTTDSPEEALAVGRRADVVVVVAGARTVEDSDRDSLHLDGNADEVIAALARERPTIVLMQIPGAVLTPWREQVAAAACLFFGGEETGHAWASVLFGDSFPQAHLPIMLPAGKGDVIEPGLDKVPYDEGLLTSYRSTTMKAAFPFGHGLSYTSFELLTPVAVPCALAPATPGGDGHGSHSKADQEEADVRSHVQVRKLEAEEEPAPEVEARSMMEEDPCPLEWRKGDVNWPPPKGGIGKDCKYELPRCGVRVTVVNSGQRPGNVVVQAYLSFPEAMAEAPGTPRLQLRGFRKTRTLNPGESQDITFAFTARDVSYYNPDAGGWRLQDRANVHVGTSSADIRHMLPVRIAAEPALHFPITFEDSKVGKCPVDWRCSGDTKVCSADSEDEGCSFPGLARVEGKRYLAIGTDFGRGSAVSPVFNLPAGIDHIAFRHSGGGLDKGSGFFVHRQSDGEALCAAERKGPDTNRFFVDACGGLGDYVGEAVHLKIQDIQNDEWGKVLVDDIRLQDAAGNELPETVRLLSDEAHWAERHRGRFEVVSKGACGDHGLRPVTDLTACEEAAKQLGLKNTNVTLTNGAMKPEGCYFANGAQVWLGRNPSNEGRGAETSDKHTSRHPICDLSSKEDTSVGGAFARTAAEAVVPSADFFGFEEGAAGGCPAGWTCSGEVALCSTGSVVAGLCALPGLGGVEGSQLLAVGSDFTTGSAISSVFPLPAKIERISFKRAGGAGVGSGFYLHRVSDGSVLCRSESGEDTNALFHDSCEGLSAYVGVLVYVEIRDAQRSVWGKVLIDDIHLQGHGGIDLGAVAAPAPRRVALSVMEALSGEGAGKQSQSQRQGRWQRITWGTCAGRRMRTVRKLSECQDAARELGFNQTSVQSTRDPRRPEGCYVLSSDRSVWLNEKTENRSQGADTSGDSTPRYPICLATAPEDAATPVRSAPAPAPVFNVAPSRAAQDMVHAEGPLPRGLLPASQGRGRGSAVATEEVRGGHSSGAVGFLCVGGSLVVACLLLAGATACGLGPLVRKPGSGWSVLPVDTTAGSSDQSTAMSVSPRKDSPSSAAAPRPARSWKRGFASRASPGQRMLAADIVSPAPSPQESPREAREQRRHPAIDTFGGIELLWPRTGNS